MTIALVEARTNDTRGGRRIGEAFERARAAGRAALIPYVVAGYPDDVTSFEIACAAIDAGADLLEIGLPYSDPLADGATLQRASHTALLAGATFERSLALVARVAAARPDVPLVPMGYANQLIGGGDGRDRAAALVKAGAAGVIVADLTPDEGGPFEAVAADAGLAVVYLVAPTTSAARRAEVAGVEAAVRAAGYRVEGIEEPGTLDGGDVLKVGSTVYVGLSGRTNEAGAARLASFLDATVVPVPVTKVLHLKSAVTALPDGTVIGHPPLVDDPAAFPSFLAVPEEAGAHVVLLGGNRVLMASSAPATAALLRDRGLEPVLVDIGEFEKLEGCVTCLSVRLR
jgi:dimethylargininase